METGLETCSGLSSRNTSPSVCTQPRQVQLLAGRKGTSLGLGCVGRLSLLCCWVCPVRRHSASQHLPLMYIPFPKVPGLWGQLDTQQPFAAPEPSETAQTQCTRPGTAKKPASQQLSTSSKEQILTHTASLPDWPWGQVRPAPNRRPHGYGPRPHPASATGDSASAE